MLAGLAMKSVVGVVHGGETLLKQLASATALWAGAAGAKPKTLVSIDLLVTDDEFERIIKDPTLQQCWAQAQALKEVIGAKR